jgi:hypothetical protein
MDGRFNPAVHRACDRYLRSVKECVVNDIRSLTGKSEWALAAERALGEARKMPPGRDRLAALKAAGKLRNEALLRDRLATVKRPDDA